MTYGALHVGARGSVPHKNMDFPQPGHFGGGVGAGGMEAARTGFVNHDHLLGQRELLLDEVQEAGRAEPLGGLRRLAIAHSDHPEMFDVPVHPEFELLDSVLRLRMERRIRFHRHV